jgi:hypothetical protein
VAIVVAWFVAAPAGRTNYLPEILANVGTTLLLVSIVVLLERRIVDNAVRKFGTLPKRLARGCGTISAPRSRTSRIV